MLYPSADGWPSGEDSSLPFRTLARAMSEGEFSSTAAYTLVNRGNENTKSSKTAVPFRQPKNVRRSFFLWQLAVREG